MLKYLRIAVSVVFGILSIVLIVLCVRSFSLQDVVSAGDPHFPRCFQFVSGQGKARVNFYEASPSHAYWEWLSMPFAGRPVSNGPYSGPAATPAFSIYWTRTALAVNLPYWCCILICVCFAALPWMRWSNRFSVRTLLIATTLVGLLLGAIVYAIR